MIRLLIVDDHEMVRAGLRAMLGHLEDIGVAGEAASAAEAVEAAARLEPDIVLMDLRLPDASGVDACREILSERPATRVLFLSSFTEELAGISTVLAGAAGYLAKDIGREALVAAIRKVAAGEKVIDPAIGETLSRKVAYTPALSKQEARVLSLVVEGKTNKQIGVEMGLSEKTVRNYLSNAFHKLGVTRRAQAAVMFAKGGLGGES